MSITSVDGDRSEGARRTIASSSTYREAEQTVDWLSDRGFPVAGVTIVGSGLRYVEQVQGRLTTGRAALMGAGQGAMIGLLFGALFGLFWTVETGSYLGVLAYSILNGAVFGAAIGALFHFARRGRRDFTAVAQTRADHYEVQVDEHAAGEVERLLGSRHAG